jgi:hypothetical protein
MKVTGEAGRCGDWVHGDVVRFDLACWIMLLWRGGVLFRVRTALSIDTLTTEQDEQRTKAD